MKKNILIFNFLFFLFNVVKAQKENKLDTIYVKCQQENLKNKYHFLSSQRDSFNTLFSFKVSWKIHGHPQETIGFVFNSLSMHYKPASNWFVKMLDTNLLKNYKNLYTLEQFTNALNNDNFSIPVANGKIHIIMLYGAACLSKVEVYPVKVSTYLASEG